MAKTIPERADVPREHRWNLESLAQGDADWETRIKTLESMIPEGDAARERGLWTDPEAALGTLKAYERYLTLEERLGYYAHLRVTENEGDSAARGMFARFVGLSTRGQAAWSWLNPAIQALDEQFIAACLADSRFADYAVFLKKLRRFKPHVLSVAEERLLALQAEAAQTAQETFSVLTNVDLDFGTVETPQGAMPLSQSTFASFMRMPDREVRKTAYLQFYSRYDKHQNTLASLYAGSVKLDKYQAQVRSYSSARAMALFPDSVDELVYDNLISTVHANLPALHRYYRLRKEILGLDELRHYDVYLPLVQEAKAEHT